MYLETCLLRDYELWTCGKLLLIIIIQNNSIRRQEIMGGSGWLNVKRASKEEMNGWLYKLKWPVYVWSSSTDGIYSAVFDEHSLFVSHVVSRLTTLPIFNVSYSSKFVMALNKKNLNILWFVWFSYMIARLLVYNLYVSEVIENC